MNGTVLTVFGALLSVLVTLGVIGEHYGAGSQEAGWFTPRWDLTVRQGDDYSTIQSFYYRGSCVRRSWEMGKEEPDSVALCINRTTAEVDTAGLPEL